LANLATAGLDDSLEGQVLASGISQGTGLIGRAFNIVDINTANFIDNFFATKIEEIIDKPDPEGGGPTVPEPSAIALFRFGLLGLGFMRRRRNR